jgi:PBP1b-binding outer membrane lipoprotein LpoB
MKTKGLTVIILSAIVLSGCIYVNDTDEDRRDRGNQRNVEPTVGQELLDLDRARASGVITDTEYDRAKETILDDIN